MLGLPRSHTLDHAQGARIWFAAEATDTEEVIRIFGKPCLKRFSSLLWLLFQQPLQFSNTKRRIAEMDDGMTVRADRAQVSDRIYRMFSTSRNGFQVMNVDVTVRQFAVLLAKRKATGEADDSVMFNAALTRNRIAFIYGDGYYFGCSFGDRLSKRSLVVVQQFIQPSFDCSINRCVVSGNQWPFPRSMILADEGERHSICKQCYCLHVSTVIP